ncbi:MAG: hypothetical protein AAF657_08075, partial [Acidobacteriota bacterium]
MTRVPYAGLRPFEADEIDVFFGREAHIDQLLEKLDRSRFLGVVGTSGCGKSSLIKAGLIPALEAGYLANAGARWRIADLRPGDRPMERLAEALLTDSALGPERGGHPLASGLLLASLRRGPLGLAEILADTPLPEHTHLLVLVDQFEEIFRYHRHGDSDEADAFVALLLQTAQQPDLPVYVVLTMRSDFLGDCALFDGLPEALNESQFLTPRLDREQRRSAIVGPASVFGGTVEPRLVNRLLNDMGDEPDQLPLMQHLMMRLWNEAWGSGTKTMHGEHIALTLEGYEAVGGFENALSRHADEAFDELSSERQRVAEKMFRALSERGTGQRDTRRPARLGEVARTAGVAAEDVAAVAEVFRSPDRSFLIPPAGVPLDDDSVLDISHESLIRQWTRLRGWVSDEGASAEFYRRLVETARLWKSDQAGLWSTPDLDLALDWKEREGPTAAWAERYGGDFTLAMDFLAASERRRDQEHEAERQAAAQREKQRRTRQVSIALGFGFALALGLAGLAFYEWRLAREHGQRSLSGLLVSQAKKNLSRFPQRSLLYGIEAHRIEPRARPPKASEGYQATRGRAPIEALRTVLSRVGGHALVGHEDSVGVIATSPDGRWLVTGSDDGTIRGWDLADPSREPVVLTGHDGEITALAISPNGRWLASGGQSDRVVLRRLDDLEGEPTIYQGHKDSITSIAFGPGSRSMLTGSEDRTAHCYRLGAGGDTHLVESLILPGAEDAVGAVAISPDGRWLVAASDDNTARIWNAADPNAEPYVLTGHTGPVRAVAISPDSRWLVTASFDNTARRWDLSRLQGGNRRPTSSLLLGHDSSVDALAISPDSRLLITGSHDNTARLWNLGEEVESLTAGSLTARAVFSGHRGPISAVAISPDGHWLVTASWDQTVRLWNLQGTQPASASTILRGHDGPINALSISPDSHQLATASADGTTRLWQLTQASSGDPSVGLRGFQDAVSSVGYSPDSRWLATASEDNTARLWNLEINNLAVEPILLAGHASSVNALAISPDNRWLATASEDNTAQLWDLADPSTARPISLLGHHSSINALAITSDSRWLATASADHSARLWDLAGADPAADPIVLNGHEDTLTTVVIDPKGRWLATGSQDFTARVWSLEANRLGREVHVLQGHRGAITALAIGAEQRRLITVSRDRTARVWDLTAEDPSAEPAVLQEHRDAVQAVAASADGAWLATGSESGVVYLWPAQDLAAPIALRDHEAAITAVAFAPDSRWLATASADETVKLWDLTTQPISILG